MISIEVVYATPSQQTVITLTVPEHTSVEQAIALSHIIEKHPEIDLTVNPVGIFSQKVALSAVVSEGARVEIYRALSVCPKAARRLAAANAKAKTAKR